jgi:hypothetical protein
VHILFSAFLVVLDLELLRVVTVFENQLGLPGFAVELMLSYISGLSLLCCIQ